MLLSEKREKCVGNPLSGCWSFLIFDGDMADDRYKDIVFVADCYQVCAFSLMSVKNCSVGSANYRPPVFVRSLYFSVKISFP